MNSPEDAANAIVCLINQTNALLDQKLRWLEEKFVSEGGLPRKFIQEKNGAEKNRIGGSWKSSAIHKAN